MYSFELHSVAYRCSTGCGATSCQAVSQPQHIDLTVSDMSNPLHAAFHVAKSIALDCVGMQFVKAVTTQTLCFLQL